MRMYDEESVMKKMGLDANVLTSGCCGMAGSFGFEQDKYEVSVAIGERALTPAVRHAGLSTIIMADGFSCREQIAQQTGRHALHLAEVMHMAQQDGSRNPAFIYPERESVARREVALRRSRSRTLATLGGVAAGGILLAMLGKRLLQKVG